MTEQTSLELIRGGMLCCDIEDAIQEATQAVAERGKSAKVQITLTDQTGHKVGQQLRDHHRRHRGQAAEARDRRNDPFCR